MFASRSREINDFADVCKNLVKYVRIKFMSLNIFVSGPFRVTFFIAEVCLLAGSVRNAYHTKYRTYLTQHPPSCEVLRKGVFGAGAAFIVFTGIVSELFYVSYSKADEGSIPPRMDGGIRMNAFK